MAGSILIRDTFEGMTAGISIQGRVPPITESGSAWRIETTQGTATSDGLGGVSFSSDGVVIQQRTLDDDQIAIRVRWNDGGSANGFFLWIGDSIGSNLYPRNGFTCSFDPRSGTATFGRITDWNSYLIGSQLTGITFTFTNDQISFERNGTSFQARVNGTIIGSFTDATRAPDGTRRQHGLGPYPFVNNSGRLLEFEILDSISAPVSGAYTIVEVF